MSLYPFVYVRPCVCPFHVYVSSACVSLCVFVPSMWMYSLEFLSVCISPPDVYPFHVYVSAACISLYVYVPTMFVCIPPCVCPFVFISPSCICFLRVCVSPCVFLLRVSLRVYAVWSVDRPLVDRLVDGLLETDRPNSSRHPDRPTFFKVDKVDRPNVYLDFSYKFPRWPVNNKEFCAHHVSNLM